MGKREIFETVLTSAYDHHSFVDFSREIITGLNLKGYDVENKPYNTFSAFISKFFIVGDFADSDDNTVGIFSVELLRGESVERARTAQRSFVKTLLENGSYAAALVAFYSPDSDKWRFSFVRMDYEFAKGKIKQSLTPARRYSYLVGKGEPCHTAMDRLLPIFMDDTKNPTVDEIEEAFSVEKVTKDFFEAYKEKYLELSDYLNNNEDFARESRVKNFTTEQFAKKLLSQIVFLYFIQKKGWLGVNAIPRTLTEKQYKNAFFSHGSMSRDLVGKAYIQDGDVYRRNVEVLQALSDEEESELARCVKGDAWGSGPKDFMRKIYDHAVKQGQNFFDDCLEPLFYTGLNKDRGDNAFFPPLHCRIPFLNGGLFEELEHYEWKYNNFDIPNELFSNKDEKGKDADGILDIFDRYNFTMAEDEPLEKEVAVDPEMLGKVFENLLEVRDRKSKGAFYTPREIVHYMCSESLINYLVTKSGIPEDDIRKFITLGEYFKDEDARRTKYDSENKRYVFDYDKQLEMPSSILDFKNDVDRISELDRLLSDVRVVDPAVGSGAFPLGLLNEIVKARDTLTMYMAIPMSNYQRKMLYVSRSPYQLKTETIKNCIFACDIEPSATDITKLRLWLSLVIEDEIGEKEKEEFGEHTRPRKLPNLDCNVLCGNSLVSSFMGKNLICNTEALGNQLSGTNRTIDDLAIERYINSLIEYQNHLYNAETPEQKEDIKKNIQLMYDAIINEQLEKNPDIQKEYVKPEVRLANSKPFILWQLYFPRVFKENSGFDIAIGNPPYISAPSQLANPELARNREQIINSGRYSTLHQKWDLYIPFMELGTQLIKENGCMTMIVPYPLTNQIYGKKLRELFTEKYNMFKIADLNDVKVFDATVQNCIPFVKKGPSIDYTEVVGIEESQFVHKYTLSTDQLVQDKKTKVWNLVPRDSITQHFKHLHVLGDYCYISVGMVPNADEKNAKGEFTKDDLISDTQDNVPRREYVEAKDIDRYKINRFRYIEYGTERSPAKLRRPTFKEFYEHEKMMFNRLGELKGTIDTTHCFIHNDSVIACVLWKSLSDVDNKSISASVKKFSSMSREEMESLSETADIRFLLGVMLSEYAAELLRDQRAGDYHIYPEHLRNIPIPRASQGEEKEIIELVDKALSDYNEEINNDINEKVARLYEKNKLGKQT